MFYAVPPYFSSRLNCPLASINAFACNAAKRLFLFIPIQNSNSAESYAPYNMYRLTPTADSLKLNYKVFFCFLVFMWVILNCKNIISKYFDLSSDYIFIIAKNIRIRLQWRPRVLLLCSAGNHAECMPHIPEHLPV